MSSIILISLVSITWDLSPLKFIHYTLTFLSFNKIDIGVLFRTHKLFTGITLPLIVILFGLSINWLHSKLISKQGKVALLLLLLFLGLIAWRVTEINNMKREVTVIPQEYFDVANWLKERESSHRVFWLPRTGKYKPGENTLWFKTEGWGAPETSLGIRTYYYYGQPMEYLYSFLMKLLEENKTKSAACILSHIGVKYLAIHDDYWWENILRTIERIKRNLSKSPYFEPQISTEHIYVYKNLMVNQSVFVSTTPIIVNGGLKSLSSIVESSDINFCNYSFFFSDLLIPEDIIYSAPLLVAVSLDNIKYDLLTNLLISEKKENRILIPSHFTKGIEKGQWRPYYIDNPHHGEWEVFYSWNYPDARYENSFRFDWGFIGSSIPGEELKIPVNIEKKGNYVILVRYFKNSMGGEIELKLNDTSICIPTIGNENIFEWFINNFEFKEGHYIMKIRNNSGRNAINIINIIPSEEFFYFSKKVDEILGKKEIILLENLSDTSIVIPTAYGKTSYECVNNLVIQSIEHRDNAYILNILVKTENSSFGITIPEQYHGGWVAIVNEKWKISSTQHLFVNNFWIRLENPGNYTIKVEFAPQFAWKLIYVINALMVTLIASIAFIYSFKEFTQKLAQYFREFKYKCNKQKNKLCLLDAV